MLLALLIFHPSVQALAPPNALSVIGQGDCLDARRRLSGRLYKCLLALYGVNSFRSACWAKRDSAHAPRPLSPTDPDALTAPIMRREFIPRLGG